MTPQLTDVPWRPFDPMPLVAAATGCLDRSGVRSGDRLLTLLDNGPASLAVSLACSLAGVIQVPVPPSATPAEELRAVVDDAGPVGVWASTFDATLMQNVEGLPRRVVDAEVLGRSTPRDPEARWPRTRPMTYTSGTTGQRKGVAVGVHDEAWGRRIFDTEARAFDRRHGPRHLVVSGLYHSAPLRHAMVTALQGGQVAILPRFDLTLLCHVLTAVRPTSLFMTPTQLRRLVEFPNFTADHLASLDLIVHAGAPCPTSLKRMLIAAAPTDSVWEFYGSTEGQFSICPPHLWEEAPGTVGRARPGAELEIRDPAADGVGVIWTRPDEDARWWYHREPDKTRAAWDGGAFTVGDVGRMDPSGRLFLHGRRNDLVISGGVNVYPAIVERVLRDVRGVEDALVHGEPDEDYGQVVVAAIVAGTGFSLDPGMISATIRDRLRPAERPKRLTVVEALPRTASGKLVRPKATGPGA